MKSPKNKKTTEKHSLQALHPFLVIFGAVIFAMILTYVVPLGRYEIQDTTYVLNGEQYKTKMVDANSFRYVLDEDGQKVIYPAPLFGLSSHQQLGILNVLFAGLSNSTESAGTVGLIAYLLVIGGSFGIVLRTGVIDQGLMRFAKRCEDYVMLFPPGLFLLFSLTGAWFGFTEYIIPLAILLIPLMVILDFDAITGILCTFGAVQLGTALCWTASDTLIMAQTIAGVPVQSGEQYRILIWAIMTFLCGIYVTIRAWYIHTGSFQSISHKSDALFRGKFKNLRDQKAPYGIGNRLVALTLLAALIWMFWGIVFEGYALQEIASLFFAMSIICGALGSAYHLNGMYLADVPRAFQSGAGDFLGAALVIGIAQGMVLLLGGINPTDASVLNTLLHWVARVLSFLPGMLAAWVMYGFHFVFNFVVPNNVGQAALSIPVMAPLADALGISRQISILAFQLGSGLSHLLMPTSGCLIAVLGIAHVSWSDWLRAQWKWLLALFLSGFVILCVGIVIQYA